MDLDSFYLGYGEMMKKAFDASSFTIKPPTYNPTQEAIKNVYKTPEVLNNELAKATKATGGVNLNNYDNTSLPIKLNEDAGLAQYSAKRYIDLQPEEGRLGLLNKVFPSKDIQKINAFEGERKNLIDTPSLLQHEGLHDAHPQYDGYHGPVPDNFDLKNTKEISPDLEYPLIKNLQAPPHTYAGAVLGGEHDRGLGEQDVYNTLLQQHLFKTQGSRLETPEQAKSFYGGLFKLPTKQLEQRLEGFPLDTKRGIRQLYKLNNFTGPKLKNENRLRYKLELNQQLEKLYKRIPGLVQNTQQSNNNLI